MNAIQPTGIGVDAHCHIDLFPDPLTIAAEIQRLQIHTIAVTNAPSVFHFTANLAEHNSFIHAAAGLHPELVKSHGRELPILMELIVQAQFVGEVGLDFVTTNTQERIDQEIVFGKVLKRCADLGGRVVTIHSRRSSGRVLEMISETNPGSPILHWFSGPKKDLRRAVQLGCWFSINPAMTRSQSGQKLIAEMPRQKVLIESDGPFVEQDGNHITPALAQEVGAYLAEQWGCSRQEVHSIVETNFQHLSKMKSNS